jgi:hypothetical protein
MSASQTRTYRISHDLAEAMDILAKEIGFASGGALLKKPDSLRRADRCQALCLFAVVTTDARAAGQA